MNRTNNTIFNAASSHLQSRIIDQQISSNLSSKYMMIAQYLYVTIKNGLVKSLVPLCSHQDSWHLLWMSVPQNISKYGIYVLSYPTCYFTIIVLDVHHHASILNTHLAIWINDIYHKHMG